MTSGIATLPASHHFRTIRQTLEHERTRRVKTMQGKLREAAVEDIDRALASLTALQAIIGKD